MCLAGKVPPLCYDFSDVESYLNRVDIKAALGVRPDITWASCNMTVNSMFENDWMVNFDSKVSYLLAADVPVLIYAASV